LNEVIDTRSPAIQIVDNTCPWLSTAPVLGFGTPKNFEDFNQS